jgi:hypothetical protein
LAWGGFGIGRNNVELIPKPMLTFNKNYFGLTILILSTEILIALFVDDAFARPYVGDALATILVYCFLKSFLKLQVLPVAIFALVFSFAIEFLQFLNIVERLGITSKVIRTVIGASFSWLDMLTYTAGIAIVLIAETLAKKEIKTAPDTR